MKSAFSKILIFSIILIQVFGFERHPFGALETLEFPPNQAISIENPFIFKVKVSCKIQTSDASDVMTAKIIKGSATLNGQTITDGTQVEVKDGDSLSITASAHGKFEITNLGLNTVVTPCGLLMPHRKETQTEVATLRFLEA